MCLSSDCFRASSQGRIGSLRAALASGFGGAGGAERADRNPTADIGAASAVMLERPERLGQQVSRDTVDRQPVQALYVPTRSWRNVIHW